MQLLRKPSEADIGAFLDRQVDMPFSYAEVGATRGDGAGGAIPGDYNVDRTRVRLGSGSETFLRAQRALEEWKHFDLGWVKAFPFAAGIEEGTVVGVLCRCWGFWWLNACRIVYRVEDDASGDLNPCKRFGFAYGTLPRHVERGEERFQITHELEDDTVWYEILAFSQPGHLLVRATKPLARRTQRRFARDSARAVQRAARPAL